MNLIFSKIDRIDVDRKFIVCLNVLKDDKGKKVWSGEYVAPFVRACVRACVCVCVCGSCMTFFQLQFEQFTFVVNPAMWSTN